MQFSRKVRFQSNRPLPEVEMQALLESGPSLKGLLNAKTWLQAWDDRRCMILRAP